MSAEAKIYSRIILLLLFGFFVVLQVRCKAAEGEPRDTWDYAEKCADTLGVEVPEFRCDDPQASVVNNGPIQDDKCATPSHGGSQCYPGTTFLRYNDTFEKNGLRQDVVTMIMCRKEKADQAPGKRSFSDIAVIQYNKTTNEACWFSRQGGDKHTSAPPPFKRNGSDADKRRARNYWGGVQPNMDCRACHDSGTFMRTPFAAKVPEVEQGKGYRRQGGRGDYQPGNGNGIPQRGNLARRATPCNVGLSSWNDNPPKPMKIDERVYLRRFPNRAPAEGQAAVGLCTSCHFIGRRFGCYLVPDGIGRENTSNHSMRINTTFPRSTWMPPEEQMSNDGINPNPQASEGVTQEQAVRQEQQKYNRVYARAIEAIEFCCQNPEATENADGTGAKVCQASFSSPEAAQQISANGACSLTGAEGGRAGKGAKPGGLGAIGH